MLLNILRERPGKAWSVVLFCLVIAAGCQYSSSQKEQVPTMTSPYVKIVQEDERFWFSRNGEPFLAMGVSVVQPNDFGNKSEGKGYYVLDRYEDNLEAWSQDVVARLTNWNFNTIAAWSHEYLYENVPMYHTRVVWFGDWGQDRDMRLIDVFSDAYAADIDKTAREHVAPYATNSWLIGYFINNELPWYGLRGWPTDPNVSLLSRYMQLPPAAPGKQELVTYLRAFYQDNFNTFKSQWDCRAERFDDLPNTRRLVPKSPECKQAVFDWCGKVAEQYYVVCTDAIRRYDTNHLILGSRFAGRAPRPVIEACGRHCDVVSINNYRKTGEFDAREMDAVAALTKRPIMITEFSWRAMENRSGCKNTHGADVTVQTQQDRADRFEQYITTALEQPYIVGYDWFQYFDQPPGGRFDGEDSNYGLVDIDDEPYAILLDRIRTINGQASSMRQASKKSWPTYDETVLVDYQPIQLLGAEHHLSSPIAWADASSPFNPYGDAANGCRIDIGAIQDGALTMKVLSGAGWGCGMSTTGLNPTHPDGSTDAYGAKELHLKMYASQPARFNMLLNESGHGPVDAQTFDGYGHADGESYSHMYIDVLPGWNTYVFRFGNLEHSAYYGNQRGNHIIDTDGIHEIGLFFPGDQGEIDLAIESMVLK